MAGLPAGRRGRLAETHNARLPDNWDRAFCCLLRAELAEDDTAGRAAFSHNVRDPAPVQLAADRAPRFDEPVVAGVLAGRDPELVHRPSGRPSARPWATILTSGVAAAQVRAAVRPRGVESVVALDQRSISASWTFGGRPPRSFTPPASAAPPWVGPGPPSAASSRRYRSSARIVSFVTTGPGRRAERSHLPRSREPLRRGTDGPDGQRHNGDSRLPSHARITGQPKGNTYCERQTPPRPGLYTRRQTPHRRSLYTGLLLSASKAACAAPTTNIPNG